MDSSVRRIIGCGSIHAPRVCTYRRPHRGYREPRAACRQYVLCPGCALPGKPPAPAKNGSRKRAAERTADKRGDENRFNDQREEASRFDMKPKADRPGIK